MRDDVGNFINANAVYHQGISPISFGRGRSSARPEAEAEGLRDLH